MSRVLVVEDEEGVRAFLASALARDGHEVVQAADGREGLRAAREGNFDVVLTDLRMPGADGMEIVREVRSGGGDAEVIVLTAFGEVKSAVEAMRLGAFDYLEKPVSSPADLRALVKAAAARRAELVPAGVAGTGGAPGPSALGGLTWGAPAMKPIVEALGKVARSSATVLLLGESGSGKEVAARALHAASPRAARPFLAVSCAVLSDELFESELFGHEKGAFTGAHATRRGRLELADGGTFFLDEVAELKPALQAKMLRVLEERAFDRLGASRPIAVDVRWVAATHRDLRAMVKAGTFREDLYHRLAVFPVLLPPLRDRREDLLPLAQAILARLAAASGRAPPELDAGARARIEAAPWPGNARELRNALERAVILAEGARIRAEHLWLESDAAPAHRAGAPATGTLEEMERAAIAGALATSGGNRRAAAKHLGIGLRTLYEKLKRYDLG